MATEIVTLRNAGSDIGKLVETFRALYTKHKTFPFTLDDSVEVAVEHGLMSSKGRKGVDARARSYNENVSLDSMPMQFKAYAEMFRLLGWLRSESNQKRTTYRVTFLGEQVATKNDPMPLVEQCFLGIDLPNEVVDRDCDNKVRLLWCYLRTMRELDSKGVKNEFILLCHAIRDDENKADFSRRLTQLKKLRALPVTPSARRRTLAAEVGKLASAATPKPLQANTLGNSTRVTIAALKAFGWTRSDPDDNIYQRDVFRLSDAAKQMVADYPKFFRPKCEDVMQMDPDMRGYIARAGLVHFFRRAAYDTKGLEGRLEYDMAIKGIADAFKIDLETPILFSPYQALSPDELVRILGGFIENTDMLSGDSSRQASSLASKPTQIYPTQIISQLRLVDSTVQQGPEGKGMLEISLKRAYDNTGSIEGTVAQIFDMYAATNKNVFYEGVAEAFRILGLDCFVEREGQNGVRWDAICRNKGRSIPIEIKSPGEEEFISVKAIRQAVENRIVLFARQTYPTKLDVSSYVVGYKYPNERAEVHELIDYVEKAFGIKVALFSFETLLNLVTNKIVRKKDPDVEDFFSLIGLVEIRA